MGHAYALQEHSCRVPPQQGLSVWMQGVGGENEALGPLVLLDTAGCGMEEAADEDSDSKRNEGEAKVSQRSYTNTSHKDTCSAPRCSELSGMFKRQRTEQLLS